MNGSVRELEKFPPLDFTIGEFIRDKVIMSENQKEVTNILYYENAKIVRGYEYSVKHRTYVDSEISRTEMEEEDIKAELTEVMLEEDAEVKAKEEAELKELELIEMLRNGNPEEIDDEEDEDYNEEESEEE